MLLARVLKGELTSKLSFYGIWIFQEEQEEDEQEEEKEEKEDEESEKEEKEDADDDEEEENEDEDDDEEDEKPKATTKSKSKKACQHCVGEIFGSSFEVMRVASSNHGHAPRLPTTMTMRMRRMSRCHSHGLAMILALSQLVSIGWHGRGESTGR